MRSNRLGFKLVSLGFLTVIILCSSTHAFSQTPFYQGKILTILSASPAGGSGDLRIKAAVPFLRKYIPGQSDYRDRLYARGRRPKACQSFI